MKEESKWRVLQYSALQLNQNPRGEWNLKREFLNLKYRQLLGKTKLTFTKATLRITFLNTIETEELIFDDILSN